MRNAEPAVTGNTISVSRNILQWEWYKTKNMAHFFTYLLLKANWKASSFQGVTIKRGQLMFGRLKASKDVGLTEMEIRTCIKRLKSTNEITIKSTNKFSIITICKYDDYQIPPSKNNQQNNQQVNHQVTSKQPASNQQVTTSEEGLIRVIRENTNSNENSENSGQAGKKDFDVELLLNPPSFPNWREEVTIFLKEKYFIEQVAKDQKMDYAEVFTLMQKFVYDKNLEGDFKNVPALKKHFTRWLPKHFQHRLNTKGMASAGFHECPTDFDYNSDNVNKW